MDAHLFLTGFMGSGKSTIGKSLARRMNKPFIDTDDQIEKKLKMEIIDIFAKYGEAWFRDYEEKVVEDLVSATDKAVISLGGGTLLSQKTTGLILKSGFLIFIRSRPEEIWKRIKHSTRRPLLSPENEVWEKQEFLKRTAILLKQREKGYNAAQLCIDRDGKEVAEIVDEIKTHLNRYDLHWQNGNTPV